MKIDKMINTQRLQAEYEAAASSFVKRRVQFYDREMPKDVAEVAQLLEHYLRGDEEVFGLLPYEVAFIEAVWHEVMFHSEQHRDWTKAELVVVRALNQKMKSVESAAI